MRARKYSIYIKSLEGVSARIRFQGQKSTRKGDIEMQGKFLRLYRGFIQEIDARVNDETMDRYGIERQSLVAMEELSELQKAISKLVRNPEEKTKPLEYKGLRNNLIEEMADVIICMDQLKEFYGIDHSEIQSIIDSKQTRQRRRLLEE
jgi:hypothetical protein